MKIFYPLILNMFLGVCLWGLSSSNIVTISEQKGEQWASKAAINHQGTATVTWIKTGESGKALQAAIRPNIEAQWILGQQITDVMNIQSYRPNVAASGAITILCSNDQNQHYYTKKEGDNPWTSARMIFYPEYPLLTDIQDASVDFRGDPLILASPNNKELGVYSYHYRPNETLSYSSMKDFPKLPDSESKDAFVPRILKNNQDKLVALWIKKNEFYNWVGAHQKTDYQFLFSRYQDNKWDSPATLVGNLNFDNINQDSVTDISASLNKDYNLAIIWSYYESGSRSHKLNSIVKKTGSEPTLLFKGLKESNEGFICPSILMDDDGNTVAVWIQTLDKQSVVYAAFKPKEKDTWQGEAKILSDVGNKAEHVQLGFHAGVFVVVWGEASEVPFQRAIFGRTLTPKAEKFEWTPPVKLSPDNQNCWYPSIAFGEKGGIITWTTHVKRSKEYDIQAANLIAP